MRSPRLLLVVLVLALAAGHARGGDLPASASRAPLRAARADDAPVLDGRLDEPAWQTATPDDHFTQHFPTRGGAPGERTTVRVLYDDDALYVGIECFHAHTRVMRDLTRRDVELPTDWVAVAIDSRHDRASGFAFVVSAAGVQRDGAIFDDVDLSWDWDAVWGSAVARTDTGWSAELRIPLAVLRFDAAATHTFGLDVRRHIGALRQELVWSYVPEGEDAWMSRLRTIEGLEGLSPRRTFELRPYVASAAHLRSGRGDGFAGLGPGRQGSSGDTQVGVDLKLGLTSNLTLDVTVNPDFGQVEADPAVLNLTRFETFFPEKRPFFLESADLFTTPLQIFYSRRIGSRTSRLAVGDAVLEPDGQVRTVTEAPTALRILGAARVTGKVGGRVTVGALGAVTGEEHLTVADDTGATADRTLAPLRGYGAAMAKVSLGGASQVGVLATSVTRMGGEVVRARADHDAYVQSVFGLWAPASGAWRATGQIAVSERVGGPSRVGDDGRACDTRTPGCSPIVAADGTRLGPGDVGVAGFASLETSRKHWITSTTVTAVGNTFDANDLGFIQRTGELRAEAFGAWRDNDPGERIMRRYVGLRGAGAVDPEGVPLLAETGLDGELLTNGFLYGWANLVFFAPGTYTPYETGDGAYVERPAQSLVEVWFESNSQKPVAIGFGGGWAEELGGTGTTRSMGGNANLTLRPSPAIELVLGFNVNWDEGELRQWFYGGCQDATGAPCTVESGARRYYLARLDSGVISTTLRANWVFSEALSLATYTQLFTARGRFHDRGVIDTDGPRPRLHPEDVVADPGFTGDLDGDGEPDDAFRDTELAVNAVLRWEFSPGSTMILVYTRGQGLSRDGHRAARRFSVAGLGDAPTEEVVLLKLTMYL